MPVHAEAGRRFVTIEVEIPCTVDAAWRAVATGDGISAWFVPTTIDGADDGRARPTEIRHDFGPGMESVSTITAWDPPRRFESTSADLGPEAPRVESIWETEPAAGGDATLVRVRHAVETDSDEWDRHLAAWEAGWPAFFRLLRLRLEHWPDAPCAVVVATRIVEHDADGAWARLAPALGLERADAGTPCRAVVGVPAFAGTVADATDPRERIVLLEDPGPGLAHVFTMKSGEHAMVWLRLALFGEDAATRASGQADAWNAWIDDAFPVVTPAN